MGRAKLDNHHGLREIADWDLPSGGPERVAGANATILIVYASDINTRALGVALQGFEHRVVRAETELDAVTELSRHSIDLVLLDLATPEPSALEFCRLLKNSPATQFLPVYVIGSSGDLDEEVRALESGADEFLMRPLRPRALKARVLASLRHKAMIESLDDSETVLFSLAQSVEERDPDLGQHCHRLAMMGAAMGLTLGLPAEDILALQRGGYLHDVGKVAVPDNVLFKPGPLTPAEWDTMKAHAARGERICSGMRSLASVLPIIRHHHERWDGSGYPDGLKGNQIPLLARILQLADIYDALTTVRPYKAALSPEQAVAMLREEAHKGWRDPNLIELFADVLPTFRTNPMTADTSHFSLHALAASIERFRKEPSKSQKHLQRSNLFRDFKLVSGL